jgi:hypothetical protein
VTPTLAHPRVDVVAIHKATGRRTGWEIQLSPETDSTVRARHELRAHVLDCLWETVGAPAWAHQVPWEGLSLDGHVWRVTDGHVRWDGFDYAPAPPQPLTATVRQHLHRELVWVEGIGWRRPTDEAPRRARSRPAQLDPAVHRPTVHCERPRIETPALFVGPGWRRRPNLPGLEEFLPAQEPPPGTRLDRSTWPPEVRAEVERAEERMRLAVIARRALDLDEDR